MVGDSFSDFSNYRNDHVHLLFLQKWLVMKKPYLNNESRRIMKIDCYQGEMLKSHFAFKKFERDVFKEFGIVAGFFILLKNKTN